MVKNSKKNETSQIGALDPELRALGMIETRGLVACIEAADAMAKAANISSLAALVAMALAPLVIWLIRPAPELILMQVIISLMLFWRHRSNIRDLLSGQEGKIVLNSDDKEPD